MQTLINLDNGNAALKLTTQYYLPAVRQEHYAEKGRQGMGRGTGCGVQYSVDGRGKSGGAFARNQSEVIRKAISAATKAAATTAATAAAAAADKGPATSPATGGSADTLLARYAGR